MNIIIQLYLLGWVMVQTAAQPAGGNFVKPIDIGSRLELMVDDYLINSMDKVSFQLHHPQRAEKVLVKEHPWEGEGLGHVSVFQDGEIYRMYYGGYHKPPGFSNEKDQVFCYAESRDGVHWQKPRLGLFEWEGSKANNIIWKGGYISPFIDTRPGVPPDQRYKALAENPGIALVSPDGIRWKKLVDQPVLPNQNWGLAILNVQTNRYMAYLRASREGSRSMAYSSSTDFVHWSAPVLVDFGDSPVEHLYWNLSLPYFRAPHLYLGFPARLVFHPGEGERDRTDAVFVFSRDGFHFSRRYMEAFLRPGPDQLNWREHCNFMARGILPTGEEEMSMYYNDHIRLPTVNIRRLVLRTDGFVSVRAPYAGGEFTTQPIRFSGKHLVLNISTSAAGSVRVEIQDAEGKPLDGFALADNRFFGDKIAHVVSWTKGNDLSALIGKPIRLRFVMRDCDLYSFRFQP